MEADAVETCPVKKVSITNCDRRKGSALHPRSFGEGQEKVPRLSNFSKFEQEHDVAERPQFSANTSRRVGQQGTRHYDALRHLDLAVVSAESFSWLSECLRTSLNNFLMFFSKCQGCHHRTAMVFQHQTAQTAARRMHHQCAATMAWNPVVTCANKR